MGIDNALEEITTHADRLYDAGAVRACTSLFEKGFQFSE